MKDHRNSFASLVNVNASTINSSAKSMSMVYARQCTPRRLISSCTQGNCNSTQQTNSLGPRPRPERAQHSSNQANVGVTPTCAHDSINSLKSMTNRRMHQRFPREAFPWAGGTHQTNSPFYLRVDRKVNKFVFLEKVVPSITATMRRMQRCQCLQIVTRLMQGGRRLS